MVPRIVGAALRSILMFFAVILPSLILPSSADAIPILFIAVTVAAFTLAEYAAPSPTFIEFRDTPPYNRIRAVLLVTVILGLSFIALGQAGTHSLAGLLRSFYLLLGQLLNWPGSPAYLVGLAAPADLPADVAATLTAMAAFGFFAALTAIGAMRYALRREEWPRHGTQFNVFVNLPIFDPTAGGDVVDRFRRGARLNLFVGVSMFYIMPACYKLYGQGIALGTDGHMHHLIWLMVAWGFMPTSLIMRGLAMMRVADIVETTRQRRYAETAQEDRVFA